jgi:hypothetical protein
VSDVDRVENGIGDGRSGLVVMRDGFDRRRREPPNADQIGSCFGVSYSPQFAFSGIERNLAACLNSPSQTANARPGRAKKSAWKGFA